MFTDRVDAGGQLAARLEIAGERDVVVLGLPRGGVPVAAQVASALDAPLDVIVVRKLGVPGQPELAMGAIGEGGARIVNTGVVRAARVKSGELARVERAERAALARRVAMLRGDLQPLSLAGRTAIIVDDGVATGATASAACHVARARGAARIILATPVVAADAVRMLRQDADDVVYVLAPERLSSVGQWYDDFTPTSDAEVRELLALLGTPRREMGIDPAAGTGPVAGTDPERGPIDPDVAAGDPPGMAVDHDVFVDAGGPRLAGHVTVPADALGIVVFVHGSGSSRHSPRNRYVADTMREAGLGTLLFDLLTADEERDRANVFDIELLAARLQHVTRWLRDQRWARQLRIGWFGASTGAGAALWAAAVDDSVSAIVSRGGRPDLAGPRLGHVRAPTLLIVGGADAEVLRLNEFARAQLTCPSRLIVIPGATHLFEEPGTLAAAAVSAREWFVDYLGTHAATA